MSRQDRAKSDKSQRGSGGFVTVGVILTVVGSMMATLFGAGAASRVLDVFDGNVWLWSSQKGEVSRVNSNAGRVDMRQPLTDARNHRVQVTQTDKNLILHDLTTGKITSLDLATLGISGTVASTPGDGITVALHENTAFIIDAKRGAIRQVDPAKLSPIGKPLTLAGSLQGGTFDDDGKLWVAVPSEGTVVQVEGGGEGPRAAETFPVTETDHNVKLTVLDHGAAVVDQTEGALFTIRDGDVKAVNIPGLVPNADVPARNRGNAVAVTIPDDRAIYLVRGSDVTSFDVPGKGQKIGPAVAFGNRIYLNDDAARAVLVFDFRGALVEEIDLPDANGPLELEIREEHLFINAPNAASARVVDKRHKVTPVNKYPKDVLGSEKPSVSSLQNVPKPKNSGSSNPQQGNTPAPPRGTKQEPPGPPGAVAATAGNKSARVTWTGAAPNGAAISQYVIEGGGKTKRVSGRSRLAVIDGLDNGTEYQFTVHAVNAKGSGPKRSTNKVTPTADVPDPPASVQAVVDPQGGAKVTWPEADGQGTTIATYTVTAKDSGGATKAFPASSQRELVIPPSQLAVDLAHTFTVVATSDKGANSAPSKPSNEVIPFTKPGAPITLAAATTGAKGQMKVTWGDAADNGRDITQWIVTPSAGQRQTINDPLARAATFDGLPDGEQIVFTIQAVNEAGPGDAAQVAERTPAQPTVEIASTSATTSSITVNFRVEANGSAIEQCALNVNGVGPRAGACSGITVSGLNASTDYGFTVTAKNGVGTGSVTGSQRTQGIFGIVTCINGPSGDQRTYCNTGIRTFSGPSQTVGVTKKEVYYNGTRLEAVCVIRSKGENPGPDEINSYIYNNGKNSLWWIKVPSGSYIPYSWLNLEGSGTGPADPATAGVRRC